MLSAIVTLMVDSMATSIYGRKCNAGVIPHIDVAAEGDQEMAVNHGGHHLHGHQHDVKVGGGESQLLRYRVVAMVRLLMYIVRLSTS